jgi:hypothetical protein
MPYISLLYQRDMCACVVVNSTSRAAISCGSMSAATLQCKPDDIFGFQAL